MSLPHRPRNDLLLRTAELVDIPSVSHNEGAIADFVEAKLRDEAGGVLEIARIGDNLCARTTLGRPSRLLLAGHLDTVPPNRNERAVIEGDWLSGLGAVDMKGGLAVFMELAAALAEPEAALSLGCDLTFLFYVCEEVERRHSGLLQVEKEAPEWLEGDAAVLGEPTASLVEAGCQGVLKVLVHSTGERAHTARPWMGRNAIHRLGPVIEAVSSFEERQPVIDGCRFREALQAVSISGGVANNVVPDEATLVLNHRFAPDRSAEEAFSSIRQLVLDALEDDDGISVVLEDQAAPAAPGLDHRLLAALVDASGEAPKAKLGWTDVSFFAGRGLPAVNFGPGESTLAHNAGERVDRQQLERAYATLAGVLVN
jgi:succinyl-diaminopimelate desuccinylase